MELWEQLSQEDGRFHERMESYEALPVEERLEKYREEIRDAEKKILAITGDPYENCTSYTCDSKDKRDTVENLLMFRDFSLSKMFEIHCSDAEVARIESLNAKLYELTQQMFKRTGRFYRYILDMPLEPLDDDIEVEGSLRYWDDAKSGILHLEDDDFYGSDFQRMIPILAFIGRENHGDLPIVSCNPFWRRDCGHKSSMTDKELGIDNYLDDGDSWAESWLHHPKLDHIVMCYATHAIVTHNNYSIPDFMRLNDFEVKVEMKLQQFSEQDGSRMGVVEAVRRAAVHRQVPARSGTQANRNGSRRIRLYARYRIFRNRRMGRGRRPREKEAVGQSEVRAFPGRTGNPLSR